MLVFGKEDAQCRALHTASESRGYQCDVTTNTEGVVELYMQTHHDVMFIDLRSSASFDGEALCRFENTLAHVRYVVSCLYGIVLPLKRRVITVILYVMFSVFSTLWDRIVR